MTDVTLTLPDLGGKRSVSFKGLRMTRTRGGAVQFDIGGNVEAFPVSGVRAVAAAAVALADAPDVNDTSGDPAEELSWFIHTVRSEYQPCAVEPSDFDRDLAQRLIVSGLVNGGTDD